MVLSLVTLPVVARLVVVSGHATGECTIHKLACLSAQKPAKKPRESTLYYPRQYEKYNNEDEEYFHFREYYKLIGVDYTIRISACAK